MRNCGTCRVCGHLSAFLLVRFGSARCCRPAGASAGEVLSPLSSLSSPASPMAWAKLTDAQRVALAPFASEWDQFSEERKRNWIKIASRYKKMSPDAQKRLHERMTEWIRMTPDQRKVARENYQVSKSVPVEKRERAWDAYQKLPEEQKKKLAATERPRRPTVVSAPPTGQDRSQGYRPAHDRPGTCTCFRGCC
jgi:hypothetical protein